MLKYSEYKFQKLIFENNLRGLERFFKKYQIDLESNLSLTAVIEVQKDKKTLSRYAYDHHLQSYFVAQKQIFSSTKLLKADPLAQDFPRRSNDNKNKTSQASAFSFALTNGSKDVVSLLSRKISDESKFLHMLSLSLNGKASLYNAIFAQVNDKASFIKKYGEALLYNAVRSRDFNIISNILKYDFAINQIKEIKTTFGRKLDVYRQGDNAKVNLLEKAQSKDIFTSLLLASLIKLGNLTKRNLQISEMQDFILALSEKFLAKGVNLNSALSRDLTIFNAIPAGGNVLDLLCRLAKFTPEVNSSKTLSKTNNRGKQLEEINSLNAIKQDFIKDLIINLYHKGINLNFNYLTDDKISDLKPQNTKITLLYEEGKKDNNKLNTLLNFYQYKIFNDQQFIFELHSVLCSEPNYILYKKQVGYIKRFLNDFELNQENYLNITDIAKKIDVGYEEKDYSLLKKISEYILTNDKIDKIKSDLKYLLSGSFNGKNFLISCLLERINSDFPELENDKEIIDLLQARSHILVPILDLPEGKESQEKSEEKDDREAKRVSFANQAQVREEQNHLGNQQDDDIGTEDFTIGNFDETLDGQDFSFAEIYDGQGGDQRDNFTAEDSLGQPEVSSRISAIIQQLGEDALKRRVSLDLKQAKNGTDKGSTLFRKNSMKGVSEISALSASHDTEDTQRISEDPITKDAYVR